MRRVIAPAGLLSALLALAPLARADEVKVPLKDLPRAITEAVKARFPGAELIGAAKEEEKGKTLYEVNLKHEGHAVDASLTADGKFTEIETEIDAKDLPRPVTEALNRKFPEAKIKKAERVVAVVGDREETSFEVIATTAEKKSIEVKISADGKKVEVEDDEDGN